MLVPDSFTEKEIALLESSLSEKKVAVKTVKRIENVPWIWTVSGLRSIVRLQPSITGNFPFVATPEQAVLNTNLIITGNSQTAEFAQKERNETKVILQSGSLPVTVDDISRESISPALGENFRAQAVLIALVVILIVSGVVYFRYRLLGLSIAIVFVNLAEAFITLAITSRFGTIDLAAMTGIIVTFGTGIDSEIVITDELLARRKRQIPVSVIERFKRAFFIIVASATTIFATMLPLVLYGSVLTKLRGFAIATIVGVLVGVVITRPFFGEIAKMIVSDTEKQTILKQQKEKKEAKKK